MIILYYFFWSNLNRHISIFIVFYFHLTHSLWNRYVSHFVNVIVIIVALQQKWIITTIIVDLGQNIICDRRYSMLGKRLILNRLNCLIRVASMKILSLLFVKISEMWILPDISLISRSLSMVVFISISTFISFSLFSNI